MLIITIVVPAAARAPRAAPPHAAHMRGWRQLAHLSWLLASCASDAGAHSTQLQATMVSGARAFSLTAAVAIAMIAGAAAAPAAAKVALTVDAQKAAITHKLRPLDMGCHSDTGYSHQPMGLHAQRIYGPSFEAPAPVHAATDGTGWVDVSSGAGVGGATLDATTAFHGFSSEKLSFRGGGGGGGGRAAVANRGLGNEGLFFEAGKDYEGYFWAKASKPAKLTIAIEAWSPDGGPPKVLASTTVAVGAAGNGWAMSNFSLTPSAGTDCVGIEAGGALARANNITCPVNGTYNPQGDVSDRSAHVCVRCGGQFVLSLETPGELNLDYVYMSPGEWGRFAGLPVLAEGVKWLQGMGTSLFRMGGSFCVGNNYFWKRWRGLPWTRPSAAAAWGHDFEGGWGPFEMVCSCFPPPPVPPRAFCASSAGRSQLPLAGALIVLPSGARTHSHNQSYRSTWRTRWESRP